MSNKECSSCGKPFEIGEQIYQDGYFVNNFCSWDCMVDSMSDFFSVKKGETYKYIGDGEIEYDE